MKKKLYIRPAIDENDLFVTDALLGLSDPDDKIHDGGEGDDNDDPTVKERDDYEWGNLW